MIAKAGIRKSPCPPTGYSNGKSSKDIFSTELSCSVLYPLLKYRGFPVPGNFGSFVRNTDEPDTFHPQLPSHNLLYHYLIARSVLCYEIEYSYLLLHFLIKTKHPCQSECYTESNYIYQNIEWQLLVKIQQCSWNTCN